MWTIIFLAALTSVSGGGYFYDLSYMEGSPCLTFSGKQGLCVRATDCYQQFQNHYQKRICFFNGVSAIVCCSKKRLHFIEENRRPTTTNMVENKTERRVSEQMFEQYIKNIFGNETNTNATRTPTLPGEYPHMAALGFRESDGTIDYKCGGSLVSHNFILTAAHCSNVLGKPPTVARIGDLNLMVNENIVDPQDFDVKKIHIHPSYSNRSYYNDIALIELKQMAHFSVFVYPACLWNSAIIPDEDVIAMGYGTNSFGGIRTNTLTELTLNIISNRECNNRLPNLTMLPRGIIDTQLCAFDFKLNLDTCQGDSGGPLQLNIFYAERQYYHIVGVTSFGIFCGGIFPGVYTRISSYIDWIEQIVWREHFPQHH